MDCCNPDPCAVSRKYTKKTEGMFGMGLFCRTYSKSVKQAVAHKCPIVSDTLTHRLF